MKILNLFNRVLHYSLISIFALVFTFVATYIPQPEKVQAAGAVDASTLSGQLVQLVEDAWTAISTSISAVADPITSAMTANEWMKGSVLDGLAWSLAKSTVSRMTASIVNWVNSGFQGSPSFVQDIGGFLTEIADQEFGRFLEDLGGPFSFVCAPFKLDVRIALQVQYQTARAGQPPGASSCTLSGALQNIESFVSGTGDFISQGGWDAWFQISTNPTQYTPFGTMVGAQASANARIVNARGEELNLLNFGSGFLSAKVCNDVQTANGTRQDCKVTTPGNVISEALTFQLSTGPRSLIEADEINEIVAAVFGQLVEKAITGSAGLLGLSGGTGYTTPTQSGQPITGEVGTSGLSSDPQRLGNQIRNALSLHNNFLSELNFYEVQLTSFLADPTVNASNRAMANNSLTEITSLRPRTESNALALSELIQRFDAVVNDPLIDPQSSLGSEMLANINQEFLSMNLLTRANVDGYLITWQSILRQTNP